MPAESADERRSGSRSSLASARRSGSSSSCCGLSSSERHGCADDVNHHAPTVTLRGGAGKGGSPRPEKNPAMSFPPFIEEDAVGVGFSYLHREGSTLALILVERHSFVEGEPRRGELWERASRNCHSLPPSHLLRDRRGANKPRRRGPNMSAVSKNDGRKRSDWLGESGSSATLGSSSSLAASVSPG